MKVDVVVIGAGMAGLSCARQLQEWGYNVVILEKSRGVGGRVATRRLHTTWADHGVRALEEQGDRTQSLIQTLLTQQILRPWVDQRYELKTDGRCYPTEDHSPCYSAPEGMTAIAKWLAQGLTIWRNQRVVEIRPESEETWSFTLDSSDEAPSSQLLARAVVLAIPAPQALVLLEPLYDDGLSDVVEQLRQVEFDPCLAAIALYPKTRQADLENLNVPWRSLHCPEDPILAWVGWDSSKRQKPENPVFVIQSNCAFAQTYLDAADLHEAEHRLLQQAAQVLIPWLDQPEVVQVHRWRYGFPRHPWPHSYVVAPTSRPLICCGDWCGGATVEQALHSGLEAARQLQGL